MDREELKNLVVDILRELRYPIHQSDIPRGTIKQGHIELGALVIFKGLAADRPDGTGEVKAYFSTDSNTLNIWNGSAWVQEVFT